MPNTDLNKLEAVSLAKQSDPVNQLAPEFQRELALAGDLGSLIQGSCGCKQHDVSEDLYLKCLCACNGGEDGVNWAKEIPTVLHAIGEMSPQDIVESSLVSSYWALHMRAMKLLSSSSSEINTNLAIKLLRLRHEVLDSLLKWRRRGEQRVVVQHLTVSGSIGNLVAGGGGVVAKMNVSTVDQPMGDVADGTKN